VDDTIIEVHGYKKQGSGYSGVRGLNALLATLSSTETAPAIVAQRLRKGSAGSPRGAVRLLADALATVQRVHGNNAACPVGCADSAFYGHATVSTAAKAGAAVSVTARMDPAIKRAIAEIRPEAWRPIQYTDAVFDEATNRWISTAEVTGTPFTAFSSRETNRTRHRASGRPAHPGLQPARRSRPADDF
jgi:hypothetical protein